MKLQLIALTIAALSLNACALFRPKIPVAPVYTGVSEIKEHTIVVNKSSTKVREHVDAARVDLNDIEDGATKALEIAREIERLSQ
jgi:hypothetical protein